MARGLLTPLPGWPDIRREAVAGLLPLPHADVGRLLLATKPPSCRPPSTLGETDSSSCRPTGNTHSHAAGQYLKIGFAKLEVEYKKNNSS